MTSRSWSLSQRLDRFRLCLVDLAPIEIDHETWVCVGFEERGVDRGDNLHMAIVRSPLLVEDAADLSEAVIASLKGAQDVTVRVHSECLLSEAFGSTLCDCAKQLQFSMARIRESGTGVVVYLRQEGRGIGMRRKLRCLALQAGYVDGRRSASLHSPDQANVALGHRVDERSYAAAAGFLGAVGLASANLITGNHQKLDALRSVGIAARASPTPSFQGISNRARLELEEKLGRRYDYTVAQEECPPLEAWSMRATIE